MRNNQPVSQRKYLFDDHANLMPTTDLNSYITYANDAFIEASGFTTEEISGQPHKSRRCWRWPACGWNSRSPGLSSGCANRLSTPCAGEQGKGFAVVAGEVRSLVQRSAKAASEIKSLVENSAGQVQSGNEHASAATAEQATALSEVSSAVEDLDDITHQNAACVAESAEASGLMTHQANRLVAATACFAKRPAPGCCRVRNVARTGD